MTATRPALLSLRLRRNAAALITMAAAALLLLWGLGRPLFWSDEAITAIYSRNTLRYGWPRAWDGRNLCAYADGTSVSARDLGAWAYPLLQFYVTAGSFAVFGVNTWAGRLPHALLGLATVWLTYLVARRTGGRRVALFAAVAIAGNAQFLRFARNCRYFSLTMFLPMLFVWLYLRTPKHRGLEPYLVGIAPSAGGVRRQWWKPGWAGALLALTAVLIFHAHFLVGGIFCVSAAAAILIVDRGGMRMPTLVPMGALAVIAAGAWWLFVLRPETSGGPAAESSGFWRDAVIRLWWYARDMNYAGILPVGLVLLAAAVSALRLTRSEENRALAWTGVVILTHTLLTATFSSQPVREGTIDADIRYVAPLIPLAAIFGAVVCDTVARRHRWTAVALLALWVGTNVLSLCPGSAPKRGFAFRSFLGDFIVQTFRLRPIPRTSTEVVVDYLRSHSRPDDLVLVRPGYQTDPLMFYLGNRLRFADILPKDDKRIAAKAEAFGIPPYVYSDKIYPDFIIWFRHKDRGLRPDIWRHVRRLPYQPQRTLRTWWRDLSRPELTRRQTFPPKVTARDLDKGILIVERRRADP